MRCRLWLALFALALGCDEGGCSSKSSPTLKVLVPEGDNLQWLMFWVAQGAGYFRAAGLHMDVRTPDHPTMSQALLDAQPDIVVAVVPTPMLLEWLAAGRDWVAVANLLDHSPLNLLVRRSVAERLHLLAERQSAPLERSAGVTVASPSIPWTKRLRALRGLRLGVAPGPQGRLAALFEKAGLPLRNHLSVVTMGGSRQNEAFGRAEVDALFAHTPYLERALVDQAGVLLVHQSAGHISGLPARQIHTLAVARRVVSNHPRWVKAMRSALRRARDLIVNDPQRAVRVLHQSFPQVPRPRLRAITAIYRPAVPRTLRVCAEGLQQGLDWFPAHRTPPDCSKVNWEMHIAN